MLKGNRLGPRYGNIKGPYGMSDETTRSGTSPPAGVTSNLDGQKTEDRDTDGPDATDEIGSET
jgi:hypothetical protein